MKTEKIQRSPVMVAQEMLNNGEVRISADFQSLKGSGENGSGSLAAQMIRHVYALYLAFLTKTPEDKRLAFMKNLFSDCGKTLETSKDFIGVFGMNSSSIYASRLFENRRRPPLSAVLRLLEYTSVASAEEKQTFSHNFGLHPPQDAFESAGGAQAQQSGDAKEDRRKEISALFAAIDIPEHFDGTKHEYYARYIALRSARTTTLKSGDQKTNAANAFHAIAALGKEGMTAEKKEHLYHVFGYHPLEDGEADAIIGICHQYYHRMLAFNTGLVYDDHVRLFWALLYVLLDTYDLHFFQAIEKDKELPFKRRKYPNGYHISLLPQMFYKEDDIDIYYDLYDSQISSGDSSILFPQSAKKSGNGKEPRP